MVRRKNGTGATLLKPSFSMLCLVYWCIYTDFLRVYRVYGALQHGKRVHKPLNFSKIELHTPPHNHANPNLSPSP